MRGLIFLLLATPLGALASEVGRTYEHHLFPSEKACAEAKKGGGWFNCSQTITFDEGGQVSVMVTDIMNEGTYVRSGQKVTIRMEDGGDAANEMILHFDRTERNLVDPTTFEVWELAGD